MASDDPKLPRVKLRDERLYVEGEKEPYFQDRRVTVWLRLDALKISRGYRDGKTGKVLTESLHGISTLGDAKFAVIGLQIDDSTPIEFNLYSVTDVDKDLYWRANIGFNSPEFTPDTTSFWVSAHCSSQYFDDLLTAVRRGHVDNILVGMETTMWTKGRPWRTWHLGPPTDGKAGDDPAMAEGYISSLIWEEKFNSQSANVVAAPKPQLVELPARVYSMLTALLAMVAALLVLTFLR